MIAVPSADPVGALVPHTLKEPLIGGSSGSRAGTSFMVKDLFASYGAAQDETVFKFANDVQSDQAIEINVMKDMLGAKQG